MSFHEQTFQSASECLKNAGYDVFFNNYGGMEMCFEIIARYVPHTNDTPTLLIKIVENIDSLKSQIINEIKLVSRILAGIPLLISLRNRHSELDDDSIYIRQDIFAINFATFNRIIQTPQIPLALAYAKKGGLFYDVDGKKLATLRKRTGMSRKLLAEKVDLSPKAVLQYELKGMRTSKKHAKKLEMIFGESVIEPLQFFTELKKSMKTFTLNESLQKRITKKTQEFIQEINEIVNDIGYDVFWPRNSPFDLYIYRENDKINGNLEYSFIGSTQHEKILSDPITDLKKNLFNKFHKRVLWFLMKLSMMKNLLSKALFPILFQRN